jgi:hypothetical protein
MAAVGADAEVLTSFFKAVPGNKLSSSCLPEQPLWERVVADASLLRRRPIMSIVRTSEHKNASRSIKLHTMFLLEREARSDE